MKGAVSRQSSSFCLSFPITRPQSGMELKVMQQGIEITWK